MKPHNCEICVEFDAAQAPEHYLFRGVPQAGRILVRTDHFVLVPDYAPLTRGHLLLFSRVHTLSMADYLALGGTHASDLVQVLERYTQRYGAPMIIEHGSTLEIERESPCIAHAHFHLLPFAAADFTYEFERDLGASATTATWTDLPQVSGREYVLVGTKESVALAVNWRPPARQYARSLVGRTLGLSTSQTYSDSCIMPDVVAATIQEWNADDVK